MNRGPEWAEPRSQRPERQSPLSSRWVRKLRREIKSSPKKAAVLALLSVVALWFWAPLAAKWFGKSETDGKSAAPVAATNPQPSNTRNSGVNMAATGLVPDVAAVKPVFPRRPWQQLLSWIEQDSRMSPAADLGSGRDPFHPIEEKKNKPLAVTTEKPDVTPADAGLALRSTIVGGDQKTALIGREVYREGETIAATRGEGEFRLVEIRPREVVLERSGKLYRLGLPTTEWAVKPTH
jgi:hypothetical protein